MIRSKRSAIYARAISSSVNKSKTQSQTGLCNKTKNLHRISISTFPRLLPAADYALIRSVGCLSPSHATIGSRRETQRVNLILNIRSSPPSPPRVCTYSRNEQLWRIIKGWLSLDSRSGAIRHLVKAKKSAWKKRGTVGKLSSFQDQTLLPLLRDKWPNSNTDISNRLTKFATRNILCVSNLLRVNIQVPIYVTQRDVGWSKSVLRWPL